MYELRDGKSYLSCEHCGNSTFVVYIKKDNIEYSCIGCDKKGSAFFIDKYNGECEDIGFSLQYNDTINIIKEIPKFYEFLKNNKCLKRYCRFIYYTIDNKYFKTLLSTYSSLSNLINIVKFEYTKEGENFWNKILKRACMKQLDNIE